MSTSKARNHPSLIQAIFTEHGPIEPRLVERQKARAKVEYVEAVRSRDKNADKRATRFAREIWPFFKSPQHAARVRAYRSAHNIIVSPSDDPFRGFYPEDFPPIPPALPKTERQILIERFCTATGYPVEKVKLFSKGQFIGFLRYLRGHQDLPPFIARAIAETVESK